MARRPTQPKKPTPNKLQLNRPVLMGASALENVVKRRKYKKATAAFNRADKAYQAAQKRSGRTVKGGGRANVKK